MYAYHIWRLWYIGSYTIMAKLIKILELYYPMIQFLIDILVYVIGLHAVQFGINSMKKILVTAKIDT